MRRTQQQAMRTRSKIIESAAQTFLQHGFFRSSLSSVAVRAGVTRGAVYGHFRNKLALAEAIFESSSYDADPFMVRQGSRSHDPLGHLRSELIRLLHRALSDGEARRFYSIVYTRCELTRETRGIWRRVQEERHIAERRIAAALRDAQSLGQIGAGVDPENQAVLVHACLMGFLLRNLTEPVTKTSDQFAEQVVAYALGALGEAGYATAEPLRQSVEDTSVARLLRSDGHADDRRR